MLIPMQPIEAQILVKFVIHNPKITL